MAAPDQLAPSTSPAQRRPRAGERRPTVIVDDVHVVYKVKADRSRNAPRSHRLTGGISRMREVHAVRGVSLVAYQGESVGLLGRNGSGKSTLLRVIAGLHPATSGVVYAEGQPTLLGVGAALMAELSGARNIRLGGLAMGLTTKEIEEGYDEVVEFSGLGEFINNPLATYSSGMGARLRFAIATARTPPVLLVDEALATGDAAFRKKSEQRIQRLRDEAGTIFVVSHSLPSIMESCTRAIWLDQGQIMADGGVEEVAEMYTRSTEKPTR
jgi:teichoic acid transport system ATP-binding protein